MNMQEIALSAARKLSKQQGLTDWLGAKTSWENPFSDERRRYPYPIFERGRANGNMYWNKPWRLWTVLGYDECQQVLMSPDFRSGAVAEQLVSMHPYRRLSASGQAFVQNLLIFRDGQAHSRLRRLVSRTFTPRKVAVLEPRMQDIANELLTPLIARGRGELVESFTSKLPVQVIAELLGIPEARWASLDAMSNEFTKLFDPIRGFEPSEMETAIQELRGYIMALADVRRETPADDLISAFVEIDEDGDRLTDAELIGLVATLIIGGSETTRGLMGMAVVNLVRYPDQREELRARPDLWPNAIEEFLRYDSPSTFIPRTAIRDTEIAGAEIKAGQMVEVILAAANRDPRRYDEPHMLQLNRTNPTPLSFGHGVHHCVGAALSRSTARIGLQTFLDAFPGYDIDLDQVDWRDASSLRGPTRIPFTTT